MANSIGPCIRFYRVINSSIQATTIIFGLAMSGSVGLALNITLDPLPPGRTFEGIGAVSAGASSRLLVDYPEPQRSQILDYLFKPNYGAALQHLKVEIGGEINSTDGTEPTHQRTATDTNFNRGYEWWLMEQAATRNPNITLDCLAWGAPGWIGGGTFYSQDMANYIANYLNGAQTYHGLTIGYCGIWNEKTYNAAWIKLLRQTLNSQNLQSVQIVAADQNHNLWGLATNLQTDLALSNSIARIGVHYPGSTSTAAAQACGQPLWSSEDGPWSGTWSSGAASIAQTLNRNYITGKMTMTEIWSPISAYYDCLRIPESGLMQANQPWSGDYNVEPAIWAVAHTTQFAAPGWTYLEGGASALLPSGGSLVTLASTNRSDYSIIVETISAAGAQTVNFTLTNGLSTGTIYIWQTTQTNQFVQLGQITPSGGQFSYTFQPASIYTLTTTTGQRKGTATPPPSSAFPLPFQDTFESYSPNTTPKYFSDQVGTFAVFTRTDGQGQDLRQVLPQMGIEWEAEWQPYTIIGDANLADYDVSADVLIETNSGLAFIMGRITSAASTGSAPLGYWLGLNNASGKWELHCAANLLASGAANAPVNTWHNLRLAMTGHVISGYVDGLLVTNVNDLNYSSGLAGLGCGGWYGAQFDNFTLRQLHSQFSFNLALAATASASSAWSSDYSAAMANDNNVATRWNANYPPQTNEWLELDFPAPTSFNQTGYSQFGSRISGYQLQHWNGSNWITDVNGGKMGAADAFPTVTSTKVRLLFTYAIATADLTPSLYEFQVFNQNSSIPPVPININEWMRNNTRTLADPAGGFQPWFELYNAGATSVNLTGCYLTGSATNLLQFQIPAGYRIPALGFLLVWTDGQTNLNASGADLHVNFSLPQSSIIGLFNGTGQLVDAVDLTQQPADTSSGSRMDGDLAILDLPDPTPHQSNNQIWAALPSFQAADKTFMLNFNGFPFTTNTLLVATNLQNPNWQALTSVVANGLGAFTFTDAAATNVQRFYRACYVP